VIKETFILAPTRIADRARQLANVGLFEKALLLLQRNAVEYDVYPYKVEVRTAADRLSQRDKGLTKKSGKA
jgi:hypothetical protein